MKLSLNWLKDYVSISLPTDTFIHKLTMAGIEVEKTTVVQGDPVLELEITPNRPDCLSVLGLAREASAIVHKPKKFPVPKRRVWPKTKCAVVIDDPRDCLRYIGTVIQNVLVKPAKGKIIQRLASVGMRPINNIVDITNFSLMENGQPLHAFDYDKLAGGKIIVRRARKGEKIVTIDGVERALDPSILVIADERRPVAIAGIMGGRDTEVSATTKNILLESAHFDPVLIRRASRKLGISSDSSYRFERGVDYAGVEAGACRAVDLILELAGGAIVQRTDQKAGRPKDKIRPITITVNTINDYLGAKFTVGRFKTILKNLDFSVASSKAGILRVGPPSFRADIKETVDLIEEIARIIGYDQLPSSSPQIKVSNVAADERRLLRSEIHKTMLAQGFNEIITYTMINRKNLALAGQSGSAPVSIYNPLTQDQEIMRPTMLPSLLSVALSNMNRGQKNLKLFEVGKTYSVKGETDVLAVMATGLRANDWRQAGKENIDYYDLKGPLEQVVGCRPDLINKLKFTEAQEAYFSKGQSAAVQIHDKHIGYIGKIDDFILDQWGIKQKDVFFAELHLEELYKYPQKSKKYKPVPEFPFISRDISLAVKKEIEAEMILQTIREAAKTSHDVILDNIRFIELYEGDKIPDGQRGLVYSLTYRARLAKTLRDEEVDPVHDKVCEALIRNLGVVRR